MPRERPRKVAQDEADQAQGPYQQGEQVDEGHNLADGHRPALDAPRTTEHERHRGQRGHAVEEHFEVRPHERDFQLAVAKAAGPHGEAFGLARLGAEGLHHHDAVEALVDHGGNVADALLSTIGGRLNLPLVDHVDRDEQGEQRDRAQPEGQVGDEKPRGRHDEQHDHTRRVGQRSQPLRRGLGVGVSSREELAGGVTVEPAEGLGVIVVDDVEPQRVLDAHLRARRVGTPRHHGERTKHPDADEHCERPEHRAPVDVVCGEARDDRLVGDAAERPRRRDGGRAKDRGRKYGANEGPRMTPHKGAHQPGAPA